MSTGDPVNTLITPTENIIGSESLVGGTLTTATLTATSDNIMSTWSTNSNVYFPSTTGTSPYITMPTVTIPENTNNYTIGYYQTYGTIFSQLESLLNEFTPEKNGFSAEEYKQLKFTWDKVHCSCKGTDNCLGCSSLKYLILVLGKARVITLVEQLATGLKEATEGKQTVTRRIRVQE